MSEMATWVIKDNYDECTLGIVRCATRPEALSLARKLWAENIEGDIYAFMAPFADAADFQHLLTV